MTIPNISVCIPTYNGAKFITEQLASILPQLDATDEVIISDDSSTDKTIDCIRTFNDTRIRILENNLYKSPIYNLENALRYAKGKYIFLADQDDIWHPDKVEIVLHHLQTNSLIVSDCSIVDEKLNELAPSFFKIHDSKPGILRNLIWNSYLGCCMAFRRELLQYILPFPEKIPMHDIWIGFVAELKGETKFINEQLVYYRRHGNNASSTTTQSPYSFLTKIKFRLNLVKHIPSLLKK